MEKNIDKLNLTEIAKNIAGNPSEWVLVLGDVLLYTKSEDKKKRMIDILKKEQGISEREGLYQNIEDKDYVGIANKLFGSIWNGASFLEKERREQMRRRKVFADGFACRERVNIEITKIDLEKLLSVFPGMILSICQNEVVEAFLENEQSMSIEDVIWTPHSIMSSPKWNKWYKNKRIISLKENEVVPGNIDINGRVLVKLYGSCRQPYQMLLSEQDFELYYPEDEDEKSCVKFFLQEIFHNKNLFFLGTDLIYSSNQYKSKRLPFATGISRLLEKAPKEGIHRYIYLENDESNLEFEKYFIEKISSKKGINETLQSIWGIVERNRTDTGTQTPADKVSSSLELDGKEAERLFWELYSRRTEQSVPKREKNILLNEILDLEKNESKWSKKSVSLLAVAANRLADFYDLKTMLVWFMKNEGDETNRGDVKFYECLLQKMVCAKLSSKSLELLQMLSFYGEGFPSGFLALILQEDEELYEWKEAGIQLVNSGIYIQRHYRRHLHRRMEYADSVLKTAGTNPNKRQFVSIVEKVEHQMDDSYFYPFDKNYFSLSDIKIEGCVSKDKIKNRFEGMFKKLTVILENRSEGYGHVYSLLETELPVIVQKIEEIDDEKMQWKPSLLYYLLRENSLVAFDMEKVLEQLELLLKTIKKLEQNADQDMEQHLLCSKMMILQTWGIIESQFSEEAKQEKALEKCNEAREVLESAEVKQKLSRAVILSEALFIQKIHIYFLECRIYGRMSTIAEIRRCANKNSVCEKQEVALKKMKSRLEESSNLLKEREHAMTCSYEEMWAEWECYEGEYWFKMSQYHNENRKLGNTVSSFQEEMECYRRSENSYNRALDYYESYPNRYWMQCAHVKRNMADLYCWESKSFEEMMSANNESGVRYKKIRSKCYDMLSSAYLLYRSHADLHGIADVLQSMGNAENFSKFDLSIEQNKRSSLCFYNLSKKLYDLLGDRWSTYVVTSFKEGAENVRKNVSGISMY